MPSGLLIRLRPLGPWRIGPDSGDRDRVERVYHSDALYSAVSGAMARLGALEEWLDATARAVESAVRFSSCFPFHGDSLYATPPRSLWPPPASSRVRWKGARFVPLSVIQTLASGKPVSDEGWAVDGPSETLIAMGTQGPFRVSVRSSAAVDREGTAVAPHSSACLEFAHNAGLWMTVAFASAEAREKWKAPVIAALRLLADSGFGGKRSSGWGRAEISVSDSEPLLKSSNGSGDSAWWMLSLYHPSPGDSVDWARGDYAIVTRSGRVESDAGWGGAKRPTRMIAEGSVVVAASEPRGVATDVAPEGFPHPVYRAGYALAIPIPLRPTREPLLPPMPVREAPVREAPVREAPHRETLLPPMPPREEVVETPAAETAPSQEPPPEPTPEPAPPAPEPTPIDEPAPIEEPPSEEPPVKEPPPDEPPSTDPNPDAPPPIEPDPEELV